MSSELREVNLNDIDIDDRTRKELGKIDELVISIGKYGVFQPITVRPQRDKRKRTTFKLVAGGRRVAAAREAGLETIPALIRTDFDDLDALEIEMLENIQRKDFTWVERVELTHSINEMMKKKKKDLGLKSGIHQDWGIRDTAKLINHSYGGVQRHLQLYQMLQEFPELKEQENEDSAVKLARKIVEFTAIKKIRADQKEILTNGDKEEAYDQKTPEEQTEQIRIERVRNLLKSGDANYRIDDAFKGLQEMIELKEDKGINPPIALCEVDPPYGIELMEQKAGKDNKERKEYEDIPADEYESWLCTLCDLMYRALPDDCHVIFWHGSEWYSQVRYALETSGFKVDKIPCIWVKGSGQTNDPDRYLARTHEQFIYAWKGKPTINKRGRANVFTYNILPASHKYHPTQRPIDLMVELLETFTFPGQIILSPFLGSGTTLLAAYRLGDMAFGWDLSNHYKEQFMVALDHEIKNFHLKAEGEDDSILEEKVSETE